MKYLDGSYERSYRPPGETEVAPARSDRPSPGKVSLTSRLAGTQHASVGAADPLAGLGPGRSLDAGLTSVIGSAYRYDFSGVRIHTDPKAAFLARQHGARAFTAGTNIVFGENRYQPRTLEGDALIAHELAHVAQQRGTANILAKAESGSASGALEEDADRAAAGALARLYGGTKSVFRRLAANAGPALRAPAEVQRCTESAADRARTRLNELGSLNDADFRTQVGAMSRDETEELLGNVSQQDQNANAALLQRIRTERLVSTAESLIGDLYWAGGSGPDPSQGFQIRTTTTRPSDFGDPTQSETNTNEFAAWVRRNGQPPEPTDSGRMNCWEAVLFSGYRAGVIPFSWIANVHQQAAGAGQAAATSAPQQQVEQLTQQNLQGFRQRLQTQLPLAQQQLQQAQTTLQQLQGQLQQLQGQQGQPSQQQQQQIAQLTQQIPQLQQGIQQLQQGIQGIQQDIQTIDLVLALPQTRARIQQLQQQLQGAQPSPQTQQLQQELQQLQQLLPPLEQIEQDQQQQTRQDIGVQAYYDSLGAALGVNRATPWSPQNPVPRGDLVFFDGLAHVALSAGNNEIVSLWLAPLVSNAYFNNMQRTTIQEVVDAMQNDLGMQNVAVTHVPNPW